MISGGQRPASNNKRRQINHNPNMRQSVIIGASSQNVYRDQQQHNQDAQASSNNLLNKTSAKSQNTAHSQMKVNKRTASLKEGSLNAVNYQMIQGAPQQ